MAPAVDVVIVTYRCRELARTCLERLRDDPPSPPLAVRVIDNASGDGTVELVAREFPGVEAIACERNLGFARAQNLGIAAGEAPYVLVLNPDTEVGGAALDRLVDVIEGRPEIGIIGPRLEREDGSFDHAAKRSFPTPLSALGHFAGVGRRRDSGRLAAYRAPDVDAGPVDAVNGAFMLIRRAALEEVGAFDEGYWMYMEDLDLCYRFAEAGWITWYEPTATALHHKGGSAGPLRGPRLNHAFHRGMYRFYRTHYAPQRGAAQNAAVYGAIALKLAGSMAANAARSALSGGR